MKLIPQFLHNIQSVAKYESKVLMRSWFFKIFTILAILILSFFNVSILLLEDGPSLWILKAVPSNIPYVNMLLLNTGQAIVAIFLASEFLKRDKQLDTSEVFYVRPLSNAEYVFGKIWGNLRVFFILSLVIMGITLAFNIAAMDTSVDWLAYCYYFFLITVPTLIYIMGLSIFLMLVLKNQALTFIILLGYIGVTIFYIGDKFYYLFDYMAYSLPLFKSTIVGFSDLSVILNHRAIYLFFGLGFIFFTIFLFRRLPNSSKGHYPWMFLSFLFFGVGGYFGYYHVSSILQQDKTREAYIELNNEYVHAPKMIIDQYNLTVSQHPKSVEVNALLTGSPLTESNVFTFCLNPGLRIEKVTQNDQPLNYERKDQILLIDFGRSLTPKDTVTFNIQYAGIIDESICYLDIPEDQLREENKEFLINIGKKYSFITADYVMLTPETFWYPRPGTAFSNTSPDWQQTYFSQFTLEVNPLKGLTPISQGVVSKDSLEGTYLFTPDYTAQTLSLIIGDYRSDSIQTDSVTYAVHYLDGHNYFSAPLDSIKDTIPTLIRNMRQNIERAYKLTYPFKRFSLVEVPGQFKGYSRAWSGAQETVQPEMIMLPEKGFRTYFLNIIRMKKNEFKYAKWNGGEITDKEAAVRSFNSFMWLFYQQDGTSEFSSGERGRNSIKSTKNPYFIFPLLYNFRYNIFSTEWPIANRVIELYLLNNIKGSGWERQINGISNSEKASLLLAKESLNALLGNPKYRDLTDDFITLRGANLFAEAEINAGVNLFRDSLYALLDRNTFYNVQFEHLLDTLSTIGKTNINSQLAKWNEPTKLARYSISAPVVTQVKDKDVEVYVLALEISNNSDSEGVIHLSINVNGPRSQTPDPRLERKITFAPNETKRLVSHWDDAPRWLNVSTLLSENLPSVLFLSVGKVEKQRGGVIEPEGDFAYPFEEHKITDEIIVDNEDSLFSVSAPEVIGLLPKWLDQVADSTFKYAGIGWWGAPLQWTATTNGRYYGKYIRSAVVIKSGKGNQTATWKVPIQEAGRYEAYYYVYKPDELRWNNRAEGEYHFTVQYDKEVEDAYIDLKKSAEGWEPMGVYYLEPGVVTVTLFDECKLRSVTADAVKFVKR